MEKHNILKPFTDFQIVCQAGWAEDSETDLLPLLRLGICHWETEKSENWNKENIEKLFYIMLKIFYYLRFFKYEDAEKIFDGARDENLLITPAGKHLASYWIFENIEI